MLRNLARVSVILSAGYLSAGPVVAAAVTASPQFGSTQCVRDLASVDRSFAEAMRDLQRNDASQMRCPAWRRQIDVMKKANDIFARCTADEARTINMSQMEGSIADFRALIDEAKCP